MDKKEEHEAPYHQGIRIDKIPVKGVAGLIFVVTTWIIFLIGIPSMRGFLLVTGPLGLVGAAALYWWRRQTRW